MTPLIAARVIALVSTGLTAGIFLGHRAGVSRASTRLTPSSFIQLQQIIHQTFERMMPPLVLAAVLSTLTWTVLLRVQGPRHRILATRVGIAWSAHRCCPDARRQYSD